jgi:prevent-host-death family protein
MKRIGMTGLRAHLRRHLEAVRAGGEIVVTDRGVPVARIVPVQWAGESVESLRDLHCEGTIRLGSGRLPPNFWKLPRGKDPRGSLRAAAREERKRGW